MRYGVANTDSDYDNISAYTQDGYQHYYTTLSDDYDDAYSVLERDAGYILLDSLVDHSAQTGLSQGGWMPRQNATQEAVEWWEFGSSINPPI